MPQPRKTRRENYQVTMQYKRWHPLGFVAACVVIASVVLPPTGVANAINAALLSKESGRNKDEPRRVPEECEIVMAESSIPNSGWGLFMLKPRLEGEPISHGDIVIHLPDPNPVHATGMKRLIWEYFWDGQLLGGQYEGQRVMSVQPGIGMLTNGKVKMYNIISGQPAIDDGGISRIESHGSGASSHYHNLMWQASRDLKAGDELFINYGPGWFKERGYSDQITPPGSRSSKWLHKNGYCVDNIESGPSQLRHAGRGAFAVRDLEQGSIIAPVPVIPLTRSSLTTLKEHKEGRVVSSLQILINYCLGHTNSSVLLYPYAPVVNFINHRKDPNVELRWSNGSDKIFSRQIDKLAESKIYPLLELVALRKIIKGEEIYLNYGTEWQDAWTTHANSWNPYPDESYLSSQTMNKYIVDLPTEEELEGNPYPEHIFTSCYYRIPKGYDAKSTLNDGIFLSTFRWNITESSFRFVDLRPCSILRRDDDFDGDVTYTARIMNRPGLSVDQRIEKGHSVVVSGIPRRAILFSDKLYTSDQHLENAFRKEIGLKVFPLEWMDLN